MSEGESLSPIAESSRWSNLTNAQENANFPMLANSWNAGCYSIDDANVINGIESFEWPYSPDIFVQDEIEKLYKNRWKKLLKRQSQNPRETLSPQ
jgi:hypothetical protein